MRLASGGTVGYDKLLLATGSKPLAPPIPGLGLPGVRAFRDIADVEAMIAASKEPPHPALSPSGGEGSCQSLGFLTDTPTLPSPAIPGPSPGRGGSGRGQGPRIGSDFGQSVSGGRPRRAVVIGGGLLGLEAAWGLKQRGMSVAVVHLMPTLMERQLDTAAGELLRRDLDARGIAFFTNGQTEEITGTDRAEGVVLADGREIPADLVVLAIGIRPNIDLARAAGLDVNRGILVGDDMRTSAPGIYAVGECIEHNGQVFGLVAPIWEQARVCGARLAGEPLNACGWRRRPRTNRSATTFST